MSNGMKYDDGKQRYDLVPAKAHSAMVDVMTFGANKYAPNSWQKVPEGRSRYFAAAMRHLWAFWMGEKLDKESGLHHLAHAMRCVAFMLELDVVDDKGIAEG